MIVWTVYVLKLIFVQIALMNVNFESSLMSVTWLFESLFDLRVNWWTCLVAIGQLYGYVIFNCRSIHAHDVTEIAHWVDIGLIPVSLSVANTELFAVALVTRTFRRRQQLIDSNLEESLFS